MPLLPRSAFSLNYRSKPSAPSSPSFASLPSDFPPPPSSHSTAVALFRRLTFSAAAATPSDPSIAALAALLKPRSRSFPPPTAAALVSWLTSLTASPSPQLMDLLTAVVVSPSTSLLPALTALALSSQVPARLLASGPLALRVALAAKPDLLAVLLAPFAATPASPPPALDRAADVLRGVLVADPAALCPALLAYARTTSPSLLENLVRASPHSPAVSHLLCRLVATRTLASPDCVSVIPCHRKGLHFVAPVQQLLRDAATGPEPPSVRAAYVAVMADIAARAALIPRLEEEPDERADARHVASLGVVPASRVNDCRDVLSLFATPAPLIAVLDHALAEHALADPSTSQHHTPFVLIAALDATASLFVAVADARRSILPAVRAHAHNHIRTRPLATAVLARSQNLVAILGDPDPDPRSDEPPRLGLLRLAVVDVLVSLLRVADPDSLRTATAHTHALHRILISTVARYPQRIAVLHTRIAGLFTAVLEPDSPAAHLWLQGGGLVDDLIRFFASSAQHTLAPTVVSIIRAVDTALPPSDGGGSGDADADAKGALKFRAAFANVLAVQRQDNAGLLSGEMPPCDREIAFEFDSQSEDYIHSLRVQHLLDEDGSGDPADVTVSRAAESEATRRYQSLRRLQYGM
jgi:hypothetical protein